MAYILNMNSYSSNAYSNRAGLAGLQTGTMLELSCCVRVLGGISSYFGTRFSYLGGNCYNVMSCDNTKLKTPHVSRIAVRLGCREDFRRHLRDAFTLL